MGLSALKGRLLGLGDGDVYGDSAEKKGGGLWTNWEVEASCIGGMLRGDIECWE